MPLTVDSSVVMFKIGTGDEVRRIIIIVVGLLLFFDLFCGVANAQRHRGYHGRGPRVTIHGSFGFPYYYPYRYYYYPYRYYPYYGPYFYTEPYSRVEPPVNILPEPTYYWYYCKDTQGYYPYVASCPGGWVRVVPTPPPPGREGALP